MPAPNYIAARAEYENLIDAIEARVGSGPLSAVDEAALVAAASVEERAIAALLSVPAQDLAEIAERASVLADLIEADVREEQQATLARRIAADLRRLAA